MGKRYLLKYNLSHGRRRSTIHVTDTYTNETNLLRMQRSLGSGAYGTTRLFSSQSMKLAVKQNLQDEAFATQEEADKFKNDIKREYKLTKEAYPDDFYRLKIHQVLDIDTSVDIIQVDYRFVMPFIKGTIIESLDYSSLEINDLVRIFLRITQELLRIHKLGIIHGDVQPMNIMYQQLTGKNFRIRFLDFGLAHRECENANIVCSDTRHVAPERGQAESLPAHTNQDVYSLAYLYNYILKKIPEIREYIEKEYPSIRSFINLGLSKQPNERPSLPHFISRLALNLLASSFNIDDPIIKRLIRATFTNDTAVIKSIFLTADKQLEINIIKLIQSLITNHCYTEASILLRFDRDLLQRHRHHTTKLIQTSFAVEHLPVFLFTELLDNLPDEWIRKILLCYKASEVTPLQQLARNNRRDLIKILYDHLSWHNIYSFPIDSREFIDELSIDAFKLLVDLSIVQAEYEHLTEIEMGTNFFAHPNDCASRKRFVLTMVMLDALTGNDDDLNISNTVKILNDKLLRGFYKRLTKCINENPKADLKQHHALSK